MVDERIVGGIVLAILVLGFIAPFLISTGTSGKWAPVWFSFGFFRSKPIETREYNVAGNLSVIVSGSNGGLKITPSIEHGKVKVTVYEPVRFFDFSKGGRSYSIDFNNETNTLEVEVDGYGVEIEAPQEYLEKLSIELKNGGVKVDGKYGGLKLASIHVVNGGLDVEIEGLGSVNVSLHVVNGGLSAKLAFGNYSGEAIVEAKVSNGGLDVEIDDPGAKVKAEMEVLNGGGKFSIDGYSESFLKKKTITDEEYDTAAKKLKVVAEVRNGGLRLGIGR
ncbi:MAG: hypothetical protein B6U76_06935 [Desulfurococcales archaeon ex4484_217_2]|nr:MAG: hypothetical protein B6U76_06935 [Desulfurococcales archaeon ex4484_217_2]